MILGERNSDSYYLRLQYGEIPGFLDKLLEIIDLDEQIGFCNKEQLVFIASLTSAIGVSVGASTTIKLSNQDYLNLIFIFEQIEGPVRK